MAKRMNRNPVTDSEEMRCCLYGTYGGFHHRLIAKRLYGNGSPNYHPSETEVRRVGMILRRNKISTRDWRNGETSESEQFFNRLARLKKDTSPKHLTLRVVA